ncbi:MAG TPA: phosphotriesterase [Terriglobia bacterium]|jgi:phosphotriesterase-related protein|nr:phosphotriesterase [Terriglobia bacterium]
MKRRTFLGLTAAGTMLAPFRRFETRDRAKGKVMTVLGPVPSEHLGPTLIHEHILVDFAGADKIAPGKYDPDEVFEVALPFLKRLKSAGCETFVDCTPAYLGRDPELLRRLSKASGLHILTNTGFYGANKNRYVPRFALTETAEQLAARWVKEATDGIPPSNIRPGFIKIGVDGGPLSEVHAKLVRAAALAHRQTGLVIASHTGDGVAALEQLDLLKKHDVPPSAFIWVHAQNESNPEVHRRAAEMGAWVEFEGLVEKDLPQRVDSLRQLKQAGYLRRILISNDAGWYNVGEPRGGDFQPYDRLFTDLLPALRRADFTAADLEALVVKNPQHALSPFL